MRERTSWDRPKIVNQLRKVAEDPRSMNQDHIQQQPAADAYVIGGPSEFAEDVNSGKNGWKADLGSDGNTKRNEIGLPEFRSDTFKNPEKSPGVSPSRQASLSKEEVYARAELATKAARLMLPKTASESAIEDQALLLMDLPDASLQTTLSRLAQDDDDDDDDDGDDDEGQDKQAQQQDDDEDEAQAKQAKGLPPEFLEQQQKMKDKAKDGDKDEKKDEKKEARARKAQQDEKKQSQDQDDKKQSQQAEKQTDKEARARKAQQQDDDEDKGQDKQARKAQQQSDDDDKDQGQDKEAADQDDKKQQDDKKEACGEIGKEAAQIIRQAAIGLLAVPQAARQAAYQAMLPMLVKTASDGLLQMSQQQQLSQQQLQAQVQQMVQDAMQQQVAQGQQQQQQAPAPQVAQGQQQMPQLADDNQVLVDQLFQEPEQQVFASDDFIQMDSPTMDIGDVSLGPDDNALKAIFASDAEVQRALQARDLQNGTTTRTASTRTVGTRPTEGVSHLGGGVTSTPSSASEEISRLSGMWSSAPDVSGVFRS